jgi:glucokinase
VPTLLRHVDPLATAIGIDIGGTKIAGGLVRAGDGALLLSEEIPTQAARPGQAVLDDVLAMARRLADAAVAQEMAVVALGLGVCELVDPHGNICSRHSLQWEGLPVQSRLAEIAPAVVEADVRAHAVAEAAYGAGQGHDSFVFVTVGTGISSCLVLQGRAFAGARGNALVMATMPFDVICSHCGEQTAFVLEEVASGPALVQRYNRGRATVVHSGRALFVAAGQGDAAALEILQSAGAALGNGIAHLVNVLDPAAVVVGGGLGVAGGPYWESCVASIRSHIYADSSRSLPVQQAALGAHAGIIGAAVTALQHHQARSL